jgi:hypothetical protein
LKWNGDVLSWFSFVLFTSRVLNICAFNLVTDMPEVGFCKSQRFAMAQTERVEGFYGTCEMLIGVVDCGIQVK